LCVGEVRQLAGVVLVDGKDAQAGVEDGLEFAGLDLLVEGGARRVVQVAADDAEAVVVEPLGTGGGYLVARVAAVGLAVRVAHGDQELRPGLVVAEAVFEQLRESLEDLDELLGLGVEAVLEGGADFLVVLAVDDDRLVEDAGGREELDEDAGAALGDRVGFQARLGARAEVAGGGESQLVLEGDHEGLLHIAGVDPVAGADVVRVLLPVAAVEPLLDAPDLVGASGDDHVGVHVEDALGDLGVDGAVALGDAHVGAQALHGLAGDAGEPAVAVGLDSPVALAEEAVFEDGDDVAVRVPAEADLAERLHFGHGAGAEAGDHGTDAQFVLKSHDQGVHGAPAGTAVFRARHIT
jgi:hypothetical protein